MEKKKILGEKVSPDESAYASCRRVLLRARSAITRRRHLGRQVCSRTSVGTNTTAGAQIRGTDVLDSPHATPNRTHGRPQTGTLRTWREFGCLRYSRDLRTGWKNSSRSHTYRGGHPRNRRRTGKGWAIFIVHITAFKIVTEKYFSFVYDENVQRSSLFVP